MARVKRWGGVVLDPELNRLSHCLAGDLGRHVEAEVNSGCDATRSDDVAILDHAGLLVCGTDQRQQLGKGPVCGRAAAL